MSNSTEININEIFLLKKYLTVSRETDAIKEYFTKKNYTSRKNEYREGSVNYLAEVARDEVNAELPDHNIKFGKEIIIRTDHSQRNKLRLTVGEYTHSYHHWDDCDGCAEGELVTRTITEYFLVQNEYHGQGLMFRIDDVLQHYDIQLMLLEQQQHEFYNRIDERLANLGEEFSLITRIVREAYEDLKDVTLYTRYCKDNYTDLGKCIVIDEKDVYVGSELAKIYEAYRNEVRFYDSSDRKISFSDWGSLGASDYYEYYMNYAPKAETTMRK